MEPDEGSYTHPDVRAATVETLRRKAEAKHLSYMDVPTDTQRYRFVALNEMGRMMVSKGIPRIESSRKKTGQERVEVEQPLG